MEILPIVIGKILLGRHPCGNESASDDEKVKGHDVTEDTISVILESSDAESVHVSHNTISNSEKNGEAPKRACRLSPSLSSTRVECELKMTATDTATKDEEERMDFKNRSWVAKKNDAQSESCDLDAETNNILNSLPKGRGQVRVR